MPGWIRRITAKASAAIIAAAGMVKIQAQAILVTPQRTAKRRCVAARGGTDGNWERQIGMRWNVARSHAAGMGIQRVQRSLQLNLDQPPKLLPAETAEKRPQRSRRNHLNAEEKERDTNQHRRDIRPLFAVLSLAAAVVANRSLDATRYAEADDEDDHQH